jgi:hypothetical protein
MSNLATLSTLKNLIGVGARPNLFSVSLPSLNTTILCKAASLPGSSIGTIEVPMSGGRRYKLAGDRTFGEWTTTMLLDPQYNERVVLERLQNSSASINFDSVAASSSKGSIGTVIVSQLAAGDVTKEVIKQVTIVERVGGGLFGRSRTVTRVEDVVTQVVVSQPPIITYNLANCFISDISAIDLSYDSTDAISEYTVTWVYDYHTRTL